MIQKKWKFFKRKKYVKITKRSHAFKGFASPYDVEILNSFDPEPQLKNTESTIKNKFKKMLSELNSNSKAEIIINKINIDDAFQSIYTTVISNIQTSVVKGSG